MSYNNKIEEIIKEVTSEMSNFKHPVTNPEQLSSSLRKDIHCEAMRRYGHYIAVQMANALSNKE